MATYTPEQQTIYDEAMSGTAFNSLSSGAQYYRQYGSFQPTPQATTPTSPTTTPTTSPTTSLYKAATDSVGPDGQPIYDVFSGSEHIADPSDPRLAGVNIPNLPTNTAPTGFQSKFQKGFNDFQSTGGTLTDENASSFLNQYSPFSGQTGSSSFIKSDPFTSGLFQSWQDYIQPENQRTSLKDTYSKMMKDSGIEAIDMDLINTKNVIDGTEDDLRAEITKAGGFATESQVLALTNTRNKQLIKNYNTLLETRNAKEKYLTTMIGLEAQDRESADQRFETMFNMGMQIADMQQKMQQNARQQYQWVAERIGFDGLYNATGGDPYYVGLIEKSLGMPRGSLLQGAQQATQARLREQNQMNGTVDLGDRIGILDQMGNIIRYEKKGVDPGKTGTGSGILSSLPISVQTKLIGMAESFGSTDIVKKYNATVDGINLINGIDVNTKNPSDHQTIVYAFAKSLDPESVVREGEYATIKKYAQSLADQYGKEITNALNGTGFLSQTAIQNIKTTMNNNYLSRKPAYDNLRTEKARVIDSVAGKPVSNELLIDYSGGVTAPISPVDNYVDSYVSGLNSTTSAPATNWFSGLWSWLTK